MATDAPVKTPTNHRSKDWVAEPAIETRKLSGINRLRATQSQFRKVNGLRRLWTSWAIPYRVGTGSTWHGPAVGTALATPRSSISCEKSGSS